MNELAFIEPEIHKAATLSHCGKLRWSLRRWWRVDSRVCWVMLNPSTADASADDPTLKRCIHFSRAWGYGGLIVVNLYPFRSPSPADCRRWADWESNGPDWHVRDVLMRNEAIVVEACQSSDLIVVAWGNQPWAMACSEHMLEAIQENIDKPLHCLGITKNGSPKHPMARGKHRAPVDQQPVIWRNI
ncbi:DUF1643 domain-containing protein [Spongiibacter sp. KMU-166]|uniref:DUF1643 domain-containing protein n=1 Tax=Spongiibacter thalassae TaxID=2721624 RepID=A0ABX1GG24_9GAMM|nr:DUF1643 domain-containing protein [Spongiibacter thalassae]NKI17388.1 DUF1643 domain-containing protein [Spongiibacter thalassae]